ncbi:ankyrin repeat ph and sec7 domain containing protein secg-related [Anaeramoeba flamelloides]|uniref:Ankyrin repeat ph and sec7 domain containing protein secg-related n=1 Tax=Anaeramoeba flamelloides TaxID=1746091 RepID=A0AAV7ZN40_9EUKA|nr:ankyrin repeat ph and sec7 domain containing protein secg-related [Anaeramoeba flamelloides]
MRNGNNCLHFVITRSKLEESYEDVEYMLQKGADPNQLNGKGFSSFHLLCQRPNLPIKFFELFFRYNTDPNRFEERRQPTTPFSFLLIKEQDEDFALWELFLQNRSNPLLKCDYNQRNFLLLLLSRTTLPKRSTIKFFLDHGYSIKRPTNGIPLLSLLCNKNLDQDYLEFMLQIGTQINPKLTSFRRVVSYGFTLEHHSVARSLIAIYQT